jgi:hypothetical protein
MLSSVLNSKRAVQVSIEIMRAFVRLRETVSTHDPPVEFVDGGLFVRNQTRSSHWPAPACRMRTASVRTNAFRAASSASQPGFQKLSPPNLHS